MLKPKDKQSYVPNAQVCVLCGTWTDHAVIYEKWGYPILRCRVCGLGSTHIGSEQLDMTSIYVESYFQGGQRDGYGDYAGSESVLRAEFRQVLAELRYYGPKEGRLLEVGCAYGFFLLEAQQYFKCTGVEISEVAAEFCRSRGLNVHCGIVDQDFLRNRDPFDAVVMLDVIEHLPNPAETLALLWQALGENGSIMITTGDWDSLLARVMGQRWRLMTPPQHLFYFSRRTLTMLLAKIGFRVIYCTRPWKLVPLGLAVYQLGNRLDYQMPFLESLGWMGVPINLFDIVRIVARKRELKL